MRQAYIVADHLSRIICGGEHGFPIPPLIEAAEAESGISGLSHGRGISLCAASINGGIGKPCSPPQMIRDK